MKRAVYSPKVGVFVKTDTGVYDLTPYVVSGSVTRRLDAVSSATIEFRNPSKKFTNGPQGPIFHPMDPIVIFMTRIHDKPVQVFTGYLDTAPYSALKPGTVGIVASCTLKRLLYTYFDPGLQFFHQFLHERGWNLTDQGIIHDGAGAAVGDDDDRDSNPSDGTDGNRGGNASPDDDGGEVNDASFGRLLYDIVRYVGNWDDETVYVEHLPVGIVDLVDGLFGQIEEDTEKQRLQIRKLLRKIIGESPLTAGGIGGGDLGANADGSATPSDWNGKTISGKVSFFGSGGDEQNTASGIHSTRPGLALNLKPGTDRSGWDNPTTQAWMNEARAGNPVYAKVTIKGKTAKLPIIDKGPNESTDRAIDVTGAGAIKMGFSLDSFPTDAIGTAEII